MYETSSTVVDRPLENDPLLGLFRGLQDTLASTARAFSGEVPRLYAYATGHAVLGVAVEAPAAIEAGAALATPTLAGLSQLATAQAMEQLHTDYALLHSQPPTRPAFDVAA